MDKNRMISRLLVMLNDIAANSNFPRQFDNYRCLDKPQTYFDIASYIFPQMRMSIIAIQQQKISSAEQLQLLINLISDQFEVDLSNINAQQILKFNLTHIQNLLAFLFQYSKIYTKSLNPKIRSQASSKHQNPLQKVPKSARQPISRQQKYQKSSNHSDKNANKNKNHKEAKKKNQKRRIRAHKINSANLHQRVIKKVMDTKEQMLKASQRDFRSNTMEPIQMAKKQYSSYLRSYSKQNTAQNKRESILQQKSMKTKTKSINIPPAQFQKVQNFFNSFKYQLRDKKDAYLRRISSIIRKQQLQRFCYVNKIQRQTKKYLEERLKLQIEAADNQHRQRQKMIKEEIKQYEKLIISLKKQDKRQQIQQRKQLKETKRKQLQTIQNFIRQDNSKILMDLQEGGKLQAAILKMYKKL